MAEYARDSTAHILNTIYICVLFTVNLVVTESIDRSTKPQISTSDMFGDLMKDDASHRKVIVPGGLPDKFLSVCLNNTQKNIETCGILAAKLNANSFTGMYLSLRRVYCAICALYIVQCTGTHIHIPKSTWYTSTVTHLYYS